MPEDDIIRDLVRRFRAYGTGSVPDDVWDRVEREARQAWAGERVYIARRPRDPDGKLARFEAALAAGSTWSEASASAGVSRGWASELRRARRWFVR